MNGDDGEDYLRGKHLKIKKDMKVLLITKDTFQKMKTYFVENGLASPEPTEMSYDIRFAEFDGENLKDIILNNKTFYLMIFNDYIEEISTLITYTEIDTYYERDRKEFTFNSTDEFCSKLISYKKYLSKDNGTVQVIDYILKALIKAN